MTTGSLQSTAAIVVSALVVSCTQPVTNNAAANEAEIKAFFAEFSAAMSKPDVVALDSMWADEFTFLSHDGEILTKAQLLELLKSGTERFESVALEDVNLRTYGDTAVVRARATQKATLEGKDHSGSTVASIVLVKGENRWRMVLAHLGELR